MFLILKMENYKYKMPCLHKFPVFASMCLTGFILCVGLCVCVLGMSVFNVSSTG